eukprot:11985590-Heterocapsa_arctica.AAC.1
MTCFATTLGFGTTPVSLVDLDLMDSACSTTAWRLLLARSGARVVRRLQAGAPGTGPSPGAACAGQALLKTKNGYGYQSLIRCTLRY